MNMKVEQGTSADGFEYKVTLQVEKPKVVDVSLWPTFMVEWMGRRLQGVYIAPGIYAVNGICYLRDGPDDYPVILHDIVAEWKKTQLAQPAIDIAMFLS